MRPKPNKATSAINLLITMARARFFHVIEETKKMPHHLDNMYPAIGEEIKIDFQ
jgi:hypothetical protein